MKTKNKPFSYVHTDTLQWGNPSLLNNSRKSRGAILSTSSSHLPFLPLTPCPLTCSQPRALPLGWHQLFSASPHPSPRVVRVHPTLLCTHLQPPSPGSWALGSVTSSPSSGSPNLFPAPAQSPWPRGGRLRPAPSPLAQPPPPRPAPRVG